MSWVKPEWRLGTCLCICVAVGVCCTNAIDARAEYGEIVYHPSVKKAVNGLRVEVDNRWAAGSGYRPIRIRMFTTTGAAVPTDRTFEIKHKVNDGVFDGYGQTAIVNATLTIPQGNASGTTTMSLPQQSWMSEWSMWIYEDGVELKEMAIVNRSSTRNSWNDVTSVLFIDRDAPSSSTRWKRRNIIGRSNEHADVPHIASLANSLEMEISYEDAADPIALFNTTAHFGLLPPDELPDQWINFTCFDLVFVSLDDLQELQKQHPTRMSALRRWANSGGTLCVYNVEDDDLADLDSTLQLSDSTKSKDWADPKKSDLGALDFGTGTVVNEDIATTSIVFRHREMRLGRVVAIVSDPFPGTMNDWGWLLNTLGINQWNWQHRHGVFPVAGSNAFWNFLIPGVGLPPINVFRVLITLFVIVIGPVNYHLLRRRQRLQLLLLTVPAGAALVTSCLIAYALVADGLGVRLRVRSFTKLNHRTGEGVSWSRQSYYAGMAPSRGLAFPDDSAIYKILPESDRMLASRDEMTWEPERQRLVRGYLKSRVPAQFLAVTSRKTRAKLEIEENKKGKPPKIENLLRTNVETLLVVDRHGDTYMATDVGAGEKFEPKPCDPADAFTRLRLAISENVPRYPPRFPPQNHRSYSRLSYGGTIDFDTSMTTSILEQNIGRINELRSDFLKPRMYIAIADSSPEVQLGSRSAREEASFHLIEGNW